MKKMKFKKTFASNIIAIFLIFNICSIFIFSYYVKTKEENKTMEYAKESLAEIVEEKSKLISISFDNIKVHGKLLGRQIEVLLDNANFSSSLGSDYEIMDDGTITRKKSKSLSNTEESSLIVPNIVEKNKDLFKSINLTETLDSAFREMTKKEEVTWTYIATKYDYLRCSPFSDLSKFYKANHSQIADVFYTSADEKHNPEKKAILTKPYADNLGKGMTVTCSQPVYHKGEMYGVVGIDVSIEKIKKKYLSDFKIGKTGKVYWLENDGGILYHPDYEKDIYKRGKVFEKNIFKDSELSRNKEKGIKKALLGKNGMEIIRGNEKNTLIVYSPIENTNSTIILEMDENEFVTSNSASSSAIKVLFTVDIIIAIFFAVILYYQFSRPMKVLVNSAKKITKGEYGYLKENISKADTEIYEVDKLVKAFNTMNTSIEDYTKTILEKNKEISSILETIDGALMIIDLDGNIIVKSKQAEGINDETIKYAVEYVKATKKTYTEQIVVNGQVYKNIYYPKGEEEIESIVVSSECITDRVLIEQEMQQVEKMAGVGQLSAAIVHELKNTLTLIKGATYIIEMTDLEKKNKEEISSINRAVSEAENVIETLLDYSKRDSQGQEMIHIGTIIKQILLLSKKEITSKNITITNDIDEYAYTYSNGREAIKVALQNIIINAIQAAEEDSKIDISVQREKSKVVVKIRDNGHPIRVSPVERIFEPFFTTKDTGTGIGLWITKRLITSLDGTIELNIYEEEGEKEFVVRVPKNKG